MKKMTTLCASLLLALGCLTANAMDSQTLVSNPGRYRVISTSPDGIAYADMDSLRAMQTMDYPNSIENMSFTLYVEIDTVQFQNIRDMYTALHHFAALMPQKN